EKDPGKVDELLGLLISATYPQERVDPVGAFFSTLESLSQDSPVETRRRVAEALPGLLRLDVDGGMRLIEILRRDWDERWKSDIRRRAIEALPSLVPDDRSVVEEQLRLVDMDEIYTVIAIVEVLHHLRASGRHVRRTERLFENLVQDLRESRYEENEVAATVVLWDVLKAADADKASARGLFERYMNDENVYIQVSLARNIRLL
ncbi:unnamed protein product, partial [marine sediment metagenome]